jgi:hypothetical protein
MSPRLLFVGLSLFGLSAPIYAAESKPAPIDYARDVRPILAKNCFACHGPDDAHRQRGLRLDRRDDALKTVRGGNQAIQPGKPDESAVIARVTHADETKRMPPAETGNILTPQQIDTLKRWIAQGAEYSEHWAFVKPVRPPLPDGRGSDGIRNPIDLFVIAKLRDAGLSPNPTADNYALVRRVSLDLRGLPPTPQEVDEFASDTRQDAYERMVDRFLADPAYGERMARIWLDLARYADSSGYGSDPLRPQMSRWRDWVIDAYNRNVSYEQFTIEQLAGDLLPNPTLDQKIATAFHRNTMTNTEGGTDDEEFRVAAVKDRVDTTFQVWMGVTAGCAKCHSHKFDPITQKEYYQLFAIFNQTADTDKPDDRPSIPVPTAEQEAEERRITATIGAEKRRLDRWTPERVASLVAAPTLGLPAEAWAVRGRIVKLERSRPKPTMLPVMVELPPGQGRKTHLLKKGNFLDPAEEVTPGLPAAFVAAGTVTVANASGSDGPSSPNRLDLARWLVSPDDPLTARVAVNRLWTQLFGTGLVETEEDFGTQGELPSHPELLDWLATEYIRLGWDTKAMLKLLLTSQTYRQSAKVTLEKLTKDPHNRLLSRGPRYRLEAETVRDQALALSGLLSRKFGGPSVFPPQPSGLWQAAFNGQRTWATSKGDDKYRRGLYTFLRRTIPYPSMATFDAPSREFCLVRRIRTNTPLQAFVTLNDPVYVEASQALARRIVHEGGETTEDRVRYGLRLCLCRPPRAEQVRQLVKLFKSEQNNLATDSAAATKLATEPLGRLPDGADAAAMAAWTVVANVLLNLDGVLTKG